LILQELDPVEVVGFSLFCYCVLVQIEDFLVQVRGERWVLVVSGGDVVKTRSTRHDWNFFNPVAGLLWSWWSLDMSMWFAPVRHVTSTRRGISLHGLAHVGHRLLLQSQMVMIWTLEGRST
jgi:hypothetical protein